MASIKSTFIFIMVLFTFIQAQETETPQDSLTILKRENTENGTITWYGDINPGSQQSNYQSQHKRQTTQQLQCDSYYLATIESCETLLLGNYGPHFGLVWGKSPRSMCLTDILSNQCCLSWSSAVTGVSVDEFVWDA